MKIKKINLQSLSQNELQRRQAQNLLGGKICICNVECNTMCTCYYTQTLQASRVAIMAHPVTVNN